MVLCLDYLEWTPVMISPQDCDDFDEMRGEVKGLTVQPTRQTSTVLGSERLHLNATLMQSGCYNHP